MAERKTQWTVAAQTDLVEILDHVRSMNPPAAAKLATSLAQLAAGIVDHPEAGVRLAIAGTPLAYRQRVLAPYQLIYLLEDTTVWIARVWHGRRDPTGPDLR